MSRYTRVWLSAAAAVIIGTVGMALAPATPAHAATGTVSIEEMTSDAVGTIDYAIYLPPGYEDSDEAYPTLYLLHGRGDTMAAWQHVSTTLDTLITDGDVPPMIVVMPDAPWNERGSWYTDSAYTGAAASGPGEQVETAITQDLVAHVDTAYRTVPEREARAVGGYSMGGAGAVRMALAHQDLFSAGLILSPAVYVPQPPSDSSARDYGGYGAGDALFDEARYTELSYPTALAELDPALPVHLFIAVGDDEWPNPDPADAMHDLDVEAHLLYMQARRVAGVTAELRVLDGGHDWDVWDAGFAEGVVDIGARLRTSPLPDWEGELLGTAGDDRAGGVLPMPDGGSVLALNVAEPFGDVPHAGGLDVVVQRRDASGTVLWSTSLATPANDRAYGVVAGADGGVLVAGYTRGDLDGAHPSGASDDAFVAAIAADGSVSWTTQLGDASAADRFYAVTADGAGGAWAAGYTSGSVATPSAGDKDALLVQVAADGTVTTSVQLGGPGEDKGQAVSLAPDGGAYLGGVAGAALPGAAGAGGLDGYVARYAADGSQVWLQQVGTPETDQFWGLVTRADDSVVAIGHTRGALGAAALGDHDVLVQAFSAEGSTLWTTQTGTSTDDRGIAGVLGADGSVMVVGTTYGALGDPVGGVDVFALAVGPDGAVGAATQLGSLERDGADEWDDPNLFAAPGSVWITGLTYGAPTGTTNAGSGDVFVSVLPFEVAAPGDGEPTDPGTGAPGDPGTDAPGAGVPPAGSGSDGGPVTGGAGGGGALPALGAALPITALLVAFGLVVVGMLMRAGRLHGQDPAHAEHR
ncbi:alpha/beta hydrolase [Pseudactinotalea suaedae]|uniref:alpha/beta hydrolase n=1 Tax=Pseudactinotalea suaedae TaxID=1524924 RepID=UPI0012E27279|nr:alpha/beta hydrolase-fold protein [Pseudactinotalea suaedae]